MYTLSAREAFIIQGVSLVAKLIHSPPSKHDNCIAIAPVRRETSQRQHVDSFRVRFSIFTTVESENNVCDTFYLAYATKREPVAKQSWFADDE